jgi:tRNA-2-methylthio-N6-dimethylallyladenosine synthase
LVEGKSKTNPRMITGRTETGKLVNFKGSLELAGQIVPVKIIEAKTFSLIGEIID